MMTLNRLRVLLGRARRVLRLEFLRDRLLRVPDGATTTVAGMRLRITDGLNAYMQYKDEFVRRNYAFESSSPEPVVIDGGANIGMFTIATLRDHPGARITAFEPDATIFGMLRENLDANGARGVTLVNAAIGATDGTMSFTPDGQAGGALDRSGFMQVRVQRLSRHIVGPVDFLKLNIEGAELDVLRELAESGAIAHVRAMVVEYHGWPNGEQRLGAILQLLDGAGFRYLLHDQDDQSNPRTKPPFTPPGDQPWFALIYAWRHDLGMNRPR